MPVTIEELEVKIAAWQCPNMTITLDTDVAVRISKSRGSEGVWAFKKMDNPDIPEAEKEMLETKLSNLAWTYFSQHFPNEREFDRHPLGIDGEHFFCGFAIIPREDVGEKLKRLVDFFEQLKKTYPLGFRCWQLFANKKPEGLYRLREYTRKVLNGSGKFGRIWYKDGDIKNGLDSYDLNDLREDVFMATLGKVFSDAKNSHSLEALVKGLQYLGFRVSYNLGSAIKRRIEPTTIYNTKDRFRAFIKTDEKDNSDSPEDEVSFQRFLKGRLFAFYEVA